MLQQFCFRERLHTLVLELVSKYRTYCKQADIDRLTEEGDAESVAWTLQPVIVWCALV